MDDRAYVTLKYAHHVTDTLDLSADVYYDRSDFQIGYPEVPLSFEEQQTGEWGGGEVQLNQKIWDKHVITVGGEYRDDFVQKPAWYEPAAILEQGCSADFVQRPAAQLRRIFAQGDFAIFTNLHLNAGVRYDEYDAGSIPPSARARPSFYDPGLPQSPPSS